MRTEVTAVVGACGPERQQFARYLAERYLADLVPAQRIADDPGVVELALTFASQGVRDRPLVVEYPLEVPTLHVIGELAEGAEPAKLTDVVCLVDAVHLIRDLTSTEHLRLVGHRDQDAPIYAPRAELVVTQIEYASIVVLANTENLTARELNLLLSLITSCAPKAHIDLAECPDRLPPKGLMGSFTLEQTHAGWVSMLNGDFVPQFKDSAVTTLHYEQLRPFHPGRLRQVMDRYAHSPQAGMLLRSAGFCHLATRSHITAHWNQVGSHLTLFPAAFDHQLGPEDEPLAFGQELALIGLGVEARHLQADLNYAALSDGELAGGPQLWATFLDPYPQWRTADH